MRRTLSIGHFTLNKHDVKTAQKSAQNVAFLDKEVTQAKLVVVLRAKLRRNCFGNEPSVAAFNFQGLMTKSKECCQGHCL